MKHDDAAARTYTWEEISWITGLSIHDLLEMFSDARVKGEASEELPVRVDAKVLQLLAGATESTRNIH